MKKHHTSAFKKIKKHTVKNMLAGVFLLLAASAVAQPQPLIRQYMFNLTSINPAFSGSTGGIEGAVLYDNQWTGFNGAPHTIYGQVNAPVKSIALGGSLYGEWVGVHSNYNLTGMFAYLINLKHNRHLSLGMQASIAYAHDNGSQLTTTFSGDEVFQTDAGVAQFNAGAGIAYYDKHFKAGFAVPQLLLNYTNYPLKENKIQAARFNFNLNASYNIEIAKVFAVEPMMVLRSTPADRFLMDVDVMLKYKYIFWIAPFYRINTAFGGMVGFGLGKQVKLSYAYEVVQSPVLMGANTGTHEIMLGWDIITKKSKVAQSPRYL